MTDFRATVVNPKKDSDKSDAKKYLCPKNGCDVSLRVQQANNRTITMLPIEWDSSADPLSPDSYAHAAINLAESDGEITKVELLKTPNADTDGLPGNPEVLYTWEK